MKHIFILGLTLWFTWYILRLVTKIKAKPYDRAIRSQSDMHRTIKGFFNKKINNNDVFSQLQKRREKRSVKVIIIEEKAYWVADHTFYVADAIDGEVRPETAKPVDTDSMSSKDVDKLLFILDNLENRESNDSGGTRDS